MDWQGIKLSESAVSAVRQLICEDPAREGQVLRLWLEGKGCDGFYYGINFDRADESDLAFDTDGVRVVVDPDTLEFVDGSEITWVDDERGRGFLVNNPAHRKFRGKFYKRKQWQDRLRDRRKVM